MRSTDQHVEQHEDADRPRGTLLVLLYGSSSRLDGLFTFQLVVRAMADAVAPDSLDVYDSTRLSCRAIPVDIPVIGTRWRLTSLVSSRP